MDARRCVAAKDVEATILASRALGRRTEARHRERTWKDSPPRRDSGLGQMFSSRRISKRTWARRSTLCWTSRSLRCRGTDHSDVRGAEGWKMGRPLVLEEVSRHRTASVPPGAGSSGGQLHAQRSQPRMVSAPSVTRWPEGVRCFLAASRASIIGASWRRFTAQSLLSLRMPPQRGRGPSSGRRLRHTPHLLAHRTKHCT